VTVVNQPVCILLFKTVIRRSTPSSNPTVSNLQPTHLQPHPPRTTEVLQRRSELVALVVKADPSLRTDPERLKEVKYNARDR